MKVVGLGTLCLTSQFLKQMGLKEASMPFDWIFSSPEMIAHAIRDDFLEFLRPANFEPIPLERRPHPDLHRANNKFYQNNFGVNFIYNHHDPSSSNDDRMYFARCVDRFRSLLLGGEKLQFVLFKHLQAEPSKLSLVGYSRLADLLYPHELLCIEIATRGALVPTYDVLAREGNFEIGRFDATAPLTGVSFGSQADHDAVAAIVRDRAAGIKPEAKSLSIEPAALPAAAAKPEAPKHVDQITLYRGMLAVDGWSKSGPPTILYEGRPVSAWQNYSTPRPDVTEAYGPDASEWGFTIRALVARPPIDPAKVALAFPDGAMIAAPAIVRVVPSHAAAPPPAWASQPVAPQATAPDGKRPLAVVTMAKNEPDYLPIWLRHYAQQAGAENCYILDHASDDGSTSGAPCNVIRLPESPFHEASRADLVSTYCASLLQSYEAVLYTDSDEIVAADPRIAATLAEYVRRANPPEVVTTIGMDLLHEEGVEGPLDPTKPVLAQRRWVRASHAGCKPAFIRRPYRWGMGFHFIEGTPAFHGLYNFHIAYADMGIAHRRQAKRNRFLPIGGGAHHAAAPDDLMGHIRRDTPWDRRVEVEFGGCATEAEFTGRMVPFSCQQEPVVWGIPQRFRAIP